MALARLGDRRVQRATCRSTSSPIEQLAGDLLPDADARPADRHRLQPQPPRQRRRAASSPRSTPSSTSSTASRRPRPSGSGLTLGCARCHDHKYDPFTQKEFYQLFAFFNNVPEKGRAVKYGNSPPCIKAPTPRAAGASSPTSTRELADGRAPFRRPWSRSSRRRRPSGRSRSPRPPAIDWTVAREPAGALPARRRRDDATAAKAASFRDGEPDFAAGPARPGRRLRRQAIHRRGRRRRLRLLRQVLARGLGLARGRRRRHDRLAHDRRAAGATATAVVLVDGKLQVNLVKRWLDDALRVETEQTLEPGPLASRRWSPTTARGSPTGVKVYVDGQPSELRRCCSTS